MGDQHRYLAGFQLGEGFAQRGGLQSLAGRRGEKGVQRR